MVLNTSITDNLALKIFGTKIETDGFMTNRTTGNGVAAKDYSNVGATLLFEGGDNFEALLTVEGFSDDGTLDAFHTNYNTPPGVIPAPPAGSAENDFSGGFLACAIFGIVELHSTVPKCPKMTKTTSIVWRLKQQRST